MYTHLNRASPGIDLKYILLRGINGKVGPSL